MKILIVDNFDSFTNNISQYLYEASGEHPTVLPNTVTFECLELDKYDAVVLSPGPGHPAREADFGICRQVLARSKLPILGVCLGHQGINCFYGGTVDHAPKPVHGYRARITHSGTDLFEGVPQYFEAVRYHSLVCTDIPSCLEVTASSACGLVMGIAHRDLPIWGVQFHPESIESEYGIKIFRNFVQMAKTYAIDCEDSEGSTVQAAIQKVGGPAHLFVTFERLAQRVSCADLFTANFPDNKPVFWLDCELSSNSQSHYSLMGNCGADCALIFSYDVKNRVLSIHGPAGSATVTGDFFSLMEKFTNLLTVETPRQLPFPFKGGLVGYLGYELKALVGTSNSHESELPDAIFYLPQNILVIDHAEEVTYSCHLWGRDPVVLASNPTTPLNKLKYSPGPVEESKLSLADSSVAYMAKVNECLQQIINGESYEICLTNRAQVKCKVSPISCYLRMRRISPVPYGACINTGAFWILSASPETFLTIQPSGRITSRPIKGTRPRGQTPETDAMQKQSLASSAKDRAENLMIVDLVRHDLNSVCVPGSVRVPQAFDIMSYSSVHQLVSTVEGRLRMGVTPFAAIKACFPGGSMTGAPKLRTMEIIDQLETSARGIYSGALGWIGLDGYTDLSIVIRTAVIKDGIACFGIGGAIVADSVPCDEMEETLVKASVPFYSITGQE